MFGWLRKKEVDLFRLGQDAANGLAADLNSFMHSRFDPVFNSNLGVLRDCFERTFNQPEAPPIVLARIEYNSFLENVEELCAKMPPDIAAALAGWGDVYEQLGWVEDFRRLINNRVENFMTDLAAAGHQMFIDMAGRLKVADDQWRAEHPQKAARFPPDM
jgi:hypothetical protein